MTQQLLKSFTNSLLAHDWHQKILEDDPPCGPHQWRGWSRTEVYTLTEEPNDLLQSFLDWCQDYSNRRSREAAVREELNRRGINPTP